ncbi:MAG: 5'-methylthioadenosine/S-adenosylhomocysteine nucleosidase family protein [Aureliella sp.]
MLIQTALEQEFRAVVSALEAAGPAGTGERMVRGAIAGRACLVVRTGIGPRQATRHVTAALETLQRSDLVVSIGLAGGLAAEARLGQRFIVARVHTPVPLDESEPRTLSAALHRLAPDFRQRYPEVDLVTLADPALDPGSKEELARRWSAGLCDMETYAVAAVAEKRGVPWLGARLVSDTAGERLAAWMLRLPELVERRDWLGLARQLGTHPQDLPRLIGLAYRMRNLERQLSQFIVEFILNVVES